MEARKILNEGYAPTSPALAHRHPAGTGWTLKRFAPTAYKESVTSFIDRIDEPSHSMVRI